MSNYLEYAFDKFTFKVATDRLYHPAGIWARADGDLVTLGVSDFYQQHHGDVAFAEVRDVGTTVAAGEDFATVETIKVDVDLPSPLAGTVVAVNEKLEWEAEVINQDPYGLGWLAVIEAREWAADSARLMTPEAYFEHMKTQAQNEVGT